MVPFPQSVDLKDYLDSRFDGLEKLIDAKFEAVEDVGKRNTEVLEALECRISSLERWRAYILGACLVISFVARWIWEKIT